MRWYQEHADRIGLLIGLALLVGFRDLDFTVQTTEKALVITQNEQLFLLFLVCLIGFAVGWATLLLLRKTSSLKTRLFEELRSDDVLVRLLAVQKFSGWRVQDNEVVDALVRVYMSDPDVLVRSAAIDVLNKLPEVDLSHRLMEIQRQQKSRE